MSHERPVLTLTEAAKATGVSRNTLRRRLDSDEFPNASRLDGPAGDGSGPWVVPITDLLGAGFTLHSPDDDQVEDKPDDHGIDLRIHDLEHELALERERRRAADALRAAAERNAEDLRTALRMLEARPQPARRPGSSELEAPESRSDPVGEVRSQAPSDQKYDDLSDLFLPDEDDQVEDKLAPDSPTSQRPTLTS